MLGNAYRDNRPLYNILLVVKITNNNNVIPLLSFD
jgi:hypothetical protein